MCGEAALLLYTGPAMHCCLICCQLTRRRRCRRPARSDDEEGGGASEDEEEEGLDEQGELVSERERGWRRGRLHVRPAAGTSQSKLLPHTHDHHPSHRHRRRRT